MVVYTNMTKGFPDNNTNITSPLFEESLASLVAKTMAYCLLFLVSLTGNTLIVWAIYRDNRLRTNTNILVANMAVSDIIFSLIAIPRRFQDINLQVFGIWLIEGDFGLVLCKVFPFLQKIGLVVSFYSCIFIALDRYYAVAHPFKGGFSRSRLKFIISGIWIFATLISYYSLHIADLMREGELTFCDLKFSGKNLWIYPIYHALLTNAIPVSVIAALYSLIVYKLRHHKAPGRNFDSVRMRREKQNKKILNMSVAITSLLFFSWLLLEITWSLKLFGGYERLSLSTQESLMFAGLFLMQSTITYNFFILLIFNDIYRQNFKSIFKCLCNVQCSNPHFKIHQRNVVRPQEICVPKVDIELLTVRTLGPN